MQPRPRDQPGRRCRRPTTTNGDAPAIVYSITNGIDVSIATLELETADEFKNPPVVYDAFGRTNDSEQRLRQRPRGRLRPRRQRGRPDGDRGVRHRGQPDDQDDRPRSRSTAGPTRSSSRSGSRTPTAPPPRRRSTCPPTGTGIPYVKPGRAHRDRGGRVGNRASSRTTSSTRRAGSLRLTGRDAPSSASPADLEPSRTGDDGFEISAPDDYRGPGALLLEVTTATDAGGNEDPQDPTDGYTALLSIPVQVGDDTPDPGVPADHHPDLGRPGQRPRHQRRCATSGRPTRGRARPRLRRHLDPGGRRVSASAATAARCSGSPRPRTPTAGGEADLSSPPVTAAPARDPLPARRAHRRPACCRSAIDEMEAGPVA